MNSSPRRFREIAQNNQQSRRTKKHLQQIVPTRRNFTAIHVSTTLAAPRCVQVVQTYWNHSLG